MAIDSSLFQKNIEAFWSNKLKTAIVNLFNEIGSLNRIEKTSSMAIFTNGLKCLVDFLWESFDK